MPPPPPVPPEGPTTNIIGGGSHNAALELAGGLLTVALPPLEGSLPGKNCGNPTTAASNIIGYGCLMVRCGVLERRVLRRALRSCLSDVELTASQWLANIELLGQTKVVWYLPSRPLGGRGTAACFSFARIGLPSGNYPVRNFRLYRSDQ